MFIEPTPSQPNEVITIPEAEKDQIERLLTKLQSNPILEERDFANMSVCLGEISCSDIEMFVNEGFNGLAEFFYALKGSIINKYFRNPLKNPHRDIFSNELEGLLTSGGFLKVESKSLDEYKLAKHIDIDKINEDTLIQVISQMDKMAKEYKVRMTNRTN